MAKKSLTNNLKKITSLGERSEFSAMKTVNIIFFGFTLFFALLYFTATATSDIGGGQVNIDSNLYFNIGVISGSSLLLLVMEFYPTITELMKFVRVTLIAVILVFVFLSTQDIYDIAAASDNAGDEAMIYALSSLTVGFASVAGLLNALEVVRNFGY